MYSSRSNINSGIRPPTQLPKTTETATKDKKTTVFTKAKAALGLDKQKSARVMLNSSNTSTGKPPRKMTVFGKSKKSVPLETTKK